MLCIKVADFYTVINTVEQYPSKTNMMMLYRTYRKRNIAMITTRTMNVVAQLTGRADCRRNAAATMSARQYKLREGALVRVNCNLIN